MKSRDWAPSCSSSSLHEMISYGADSSQKNELLIGPTNMSSVTLRDLAGSWFWTEEHTAQVMKAPMFDKGEGAY